MNELNEKRHFDRFKFQKPVRVFSVLPSKSGNIYEVQKNCLELKASNISEGGLNLEVEKPLDSQYLLKMNFEVEKDQLVEVYGKVVWSRENHCGVRFMLTDPVLRKGIRSIEKKRNPTSN